ncbi:MAG: type IV secretion system protein VirB4 [Glomeribacter sp. 1016415]|nr:type IV secretion system protein VirB4 [Glomeribacter sp. 1016415]
MLKLKPPKTSALEQESPGQRRSSDTRTCSELVPWLFACNPATVVCKDSSLLAAFEYSGPDTDSITAGEMLKLIEDLTQTLISLSRQPLTLWWTVQRRRISGYDTLPLPDLYAQIVDDERRQAFAQSGSHLNRHYLTIIRPPEAGLDRFSGRLSHALSHDGLPLYKALLQALRGTFSDQYAFAYTAAELHHQIEEFEALLGHLLAGLPNLKCSRLSGAQLSAFLHATCSPCAENQTSVDLSDHPFLDLALPDTEIIPGHDFLSFEGNGRKRYAVALSIPVARENWPDQVAPTTLDDLLKVQGELTINQVYRLVSQARAERFINSMRKYHDNRQLDVRGLLSAALKKGNSDQVRHNLARAQAASETDALHGEVSMGQQAYGWYNLTILAWSPVFEAGGPDSIQSASAERAAYAQASATCKAAEAILRTAHFTPVREKLHALSAFSVTIPGMWRECARWAFIDAQVLARLAPLRTVAQGERYNLHLSREMGIACPALATFPTEYGTPFHFTGYFDDVGHVLLCGDSGSGKTSFLNLSWTLFRKYSGATIYLFDKDYSSRIPVLMQGGTYLDIAPEHGESTICFNPIALLAHERHLEWLKDWILFLGSLRGYQPGAQDDMQLLNVLRATRNIDRALWRLCAIYSQLPDGPFKQQLASWVGDGAYAHYFDNLEDSFTATNLIGIEVGKIIHHPLVAPPLLDLCFYRLDDTLTMNRLNGAIAPTFIGLPEVWHLLDNPRFAKKIVDWISTLRKKLGSVWMDTQSPESYLHSPVYPSLRDNVPTCIFLPPSGSFNPSQRAALETGLGLHAGQIQGIEKGTRKRDYFITQKNGFARRISLALDLRTLAILRSELSAQAIFERHYRSGHPAWRARYFEEMTHATR